MILGTNDRPANASRDATGSVLHGHNGGVWEWTNSVFNGSDGYVPSVIYPGYSSDFFDNKHYVVVSLSRCPNGRR